MRVLFAAAIVCMAGVAHSAEPVGPSKIVYYSPSRAVVVNQDHTTNVIVVKRCCSQRLLCTGVHRIGCGARNLVGGVGKVGAGIVVGAGEIVIGSGRLVVGAVRDVGDGTSRLFKKIICYDPCKKIRCRCD